jgi:hypothetical protein
MTVFYQRHSNSSSSDLRTTTRAYDYSTQTLCTSTYEYGYHQTDLVHRDAPPIYKRDRHHGADGKMVPTVPAPLRIKKWRFIGGPITLGMGGVGTIWQLRKLPQILISGVSTFPAHTVIYNQFFKLYIITIACTVDIGMSQSVTANAIYSGKPEAI